MGGGGATGGGVFSKYVQLYGMVGTRPVLRLHKTPRKDQAVPPPFWRQ